VEGLLNWVERTPNISDVDMIILGVSEETGGGGAMSSSALGSLSLPFAVFLDVSACGIARSVWEEARICPTNPASERRVGWSAESRALMQAWVNDSISDAVRLRSEVG
jgi:hypothetical protein